MMENIQNKLFVLFFFALTLPHLVASQAASTNDLHFEVNRNYPYISITKDQLKQAETLVDLDEHYKPSWVRTYLSVEVLAGQNGKARKAVSKSDLLSPEQKELMLTADVGTEISVNIQYIPENTLKHNDPKETSFSFTVEPEREASFVGGQQALRQYLKENAIDKIPGGIFKDLQLAAVKFTINEQGAIIDPHVFWSSGDKKTDDLMLDAVCNMPSWKPAEYTNGKKATQEFVLAVGSMESCVVNLLKIRKPN